SSVAAIANASEIPVRCSGNNPGRDAPSEVTPLNAPAIAFLPRASDSWPQTATTGQGSAATACAGRGARVRRFAAAAGSPVGALAPRPLRSCRIAEGRGEEDDADADPAPAL